MHQQLIPAVYLERVAARSTRAERLHELEQRSRQLLAPLRQPDSPLQRLDPDWRREVEIVAGQPPASMFEHLLSALDPPPRPARKRPRPRRVANLEPMAA
jgi:hypothetical protein